MEQQFFQQLLMLFNKSKYFILKKDPYFNENILRAIKTSVLTELRMGKLFFSIMSE
jgi:hypothetical protein